MEELNRQIKELGLDKTEKGALSRDISGRFLHPKPSEPETLLGAVDAMIKTNHEDMKQQATNEQTKQTNKASKQISL